LFEQIVFLEIFGRSLQVFQAEHQVIELRQKRNEGVMIKDLMSNYSLSKASVYRALG
jgi:hypothetical protein